MSQLKLIIGNKNYSTWSLRPWVFMCQNNMEFDEELVSLFVEDTDDKLSDYDSDFKVPVLQDGDLTVWDSLSILEYLSENHLDGGGYPRDVKARALARSVSNEMHSSFFNIRNELPMNCRKKFSNVELSNGAKQEMARIVDIWRMCRVEFGKDGEWLFGKYSIADAMFAPIAIRFSGYSVQLDGVAEAYVQSVLRQPCIIDWMQQGRLEKAVIGEDEIDVTGDIKVEPWRD